MSENQIREISQQEFHTMLNEFQSKFLFDKDRKWGGCFIFESVFKKRRFGFWVSVTEWIAIDDTTKNFIMRSFKKRKDAINWLMENANGKPLRY